MIQKKKKVMELIDVEKEWAKEGLRFRLTTLFLFACDPVIWRFNNKTSD